MWSSFIFLLFVVVSVSSVHQENSNKEIRPMLLFVLFVLKNTFDLPKCF